MGVEILKFEEKTIAVAYWRVGIALPFIEVAFKRVFPKGKCGYWYPSGSWGFGYDGEGYKLRGEFIDWPEKLEMEITLKAEDVESYLRGKAMVEDLFKEYESCY